MSEAAGDAGGAVATLQGAWGGFGDFSLFICLFSDAAVNSPPRLASGSLL